MSKDEKENENTYSRDKDPGLVPEEGLTKEIIFFEAAGG